MADNAKRVAKNTLALYFRMIFLVFVSLFTVRVVLQVLGVEDYGLYNVVGGFVGLFSFFSGTMVNAAQRYFALSLARNDWKTVNKTFSLILVIIAVFALLVLILCETGGLWFLTTQMTIPAGRMMAALVVYELSIISFLVVMLGSPLQALLVADENLSIYALVSVFEGLAKLGIVYVLLAFAGDKLIIYSILLFGVTLAVQGFFLWYCLGKYPQLTVHIYSKRSEYKDVLGYINWNIIGALAQILKGQGVNIIINLFFGPAVNAARGIAYNINAVVMSFSQNFMKAVDPQIMKTYALGEAEKFRFMLVISSKISYFLLFVIALPLMLNISYVLEMWLGTPPAHTDLFAILVLIDALLSALTDPLCTAVHAVGKMKFYQIVVGGASLMNLPLSYGLLVICREPWLPFAVGIFISLLMGFLRMYTFQRLYPFSGRKYFIKVYIPVGLVTLLAWGTGYNFFTDAADLGQLAGHSIGCLLLSCIFILLLGLNREERQLVGKIFPMGKVLEKLRRVKGE
ncbi:lipopolysaccharide biosynthesis protein [Selenomonas caprae]|uniref:Lipopolysaccharide biosynthesis protein n=1 Tax=Selenomonas caprae TaxID=2606905 RepID=A0A5D6WL31_9FIRM|nr:lipopolysaccharide biosynthesis protein [Selenomonas caprae]TYZ27779.1 lipopolysaccharide biosynthesis protein [Selenomonas caprae]